MRKAVIRFISKYNILIRYAFALALLVVLLIFGIFQYFFINNINTYYNKQDDEELSFKNHINNTVLNNSLFLEGLDKKFNLITFDNMNENIEFIINEIRFIEKNTIYESVYYIDLSSETLITNNHITSSNHINDYFQNIYWYKNSIKYQRTEISNIMNDSNGIDKLVAMSIPIISNDQVTGFILGKVKLESLKLNQIFNYNYKNDYIYYLVDSEDNLIYKYIQKKDYVSVNRLEKFLINNFSLYKESNYQHIYDGSTFSYWKYKINLNINKIKFETFNEAYSLLIILGIFLLSGLTILSKIFLKYKKEILLDIHLSKERKLKKILKRLNNDDDFYLFFVKIENLSIINQVYGYEFGDNLLVKFAADFRQFVNEFSHHKNNLLYLGGNDFVLILQLKGWKSARKILDNLLYHYSIKFFNFQNENVKLQINYILYRFNRKQYDLDVLEEHMKKTSELMRTIFNKESLNFIVYTDYKIIQKLYEKHEKVKDFLLEVIENKAIESFMQSIVDLESGEIVQYEILMRIVDKDIYLSPYPYIRISEKYGLIKRIDYLIIEKTLERLKSLNWSPKISFNISSLELISKNHLTNLIELIRRYDYNLTDITFELTETNIIEDFELVLDNIQYLKSHNFKISLDDFGTGFSNLETLKKLETMCDYIKIDGIFIKNLNETDKEQYIVKSIVNLAKAYNMKIVAEFIESFEIQEILKKLDVDYGQGYLFSKPKKIEECYESEKA